MIPLIATVLATLSWFPATEVPPTETSLSAITSDESPFKGRLANLVEQLEKERIQANIPGMALAVVKDGQVVLTHGFGIADVETQRAVTAETIFAIGSSSKAFTSTLAGIMQDEGALDFDDPVTNFLPNFELAVDSPDEDTAVTLRDLMSHRTGFTRMTSLWSGASVPRETILKTAVNAEPWAEFRKEFWYNNVMFLAAGMATAAAVEGEWDELVRTRLFAPLKMSATTLTTAAAQEDMRLALGYEWNEDTLAFEHKKMRDLTAIAPAGGINSNVVDMAQWLRLQLGRGELDGTRLISEEALEETWSPNMQMSEGTSYGLGWMLREYKGTSVVEHGGNIDGFGAQVTLFPEENLGFVLLTNVTSTLLQPGSIGIVHDALLGEVADATAAIEVGEFTKYTGNYIGNFGSFRDATFKILVQNEHLAIHIPGQMAYELNSPDEAGLRTFRMSASNAVSFGTDESGAITQMNLHEAGMKFEMPREGVEIAMEIPLAEIERFLGTYYLDALDTNVEVVIQNGRLGLDVPGQMVFELRAPDEDGRRNFRISDDMAVRFNEDGAGLLTGLTMFEGPDQRTLPRVNPSEAEVVKDLPTLDELVAIRKTTTPWELLKKSGTVRLTGTLRMAQSGIEGTFIREERMDPPAFHMTMDFGVFGVTELGSSAGGVWTYQKTSGHSVVSGVSGRQMARSRSAILFGDWRENYDKVEIQGAASVNDQDAIEIRMSYMDLPDQTIFVDPKTGSLLRSKSVFVQGPMSVPVTTTFTDIREFEGTLMPYVATERNPATGNAIQTLEKIELGVELAPDFHVYKEGVK